MRKEWLVASGRVAGLIDVLSGKTHDRITQAVPVAPKQLAAIRESPSTRSLLAIPPFIAGCWYRC